MVVLFCYKNICLKRKRGSFENTWVGFSYLLFCHSQYRGQDLTNSKYSVPSSVVSERLRGCVKEMPLRADSAFQLLSSVLKKGWFSCGILAFCDAGLRGLGCLWNSLSYPQNCDKFMTYELLKPLWVYTHLYFCLYF